jgi:hypothetical protein
VDEKVAYDVTVDSAGLNWQQAGPLFSRYTLNLAGVIDRTWVDCYNRLAASAEYARFRLDPSMSTVSFTTRSTDGPSQVMGVVRKLEALVLSVNQEANREMASEARGKTEWQADARMASRLTSQPPRPHLVRNSHKPS